MKPVKFTIHLQNNTKMKHTAQRPITVSFACFHSKDPFLISQQTCQIGKTLRITISS